MLSTRETLLDGHFINYDVPENFQETDRGLFYDENFQFEIPSVDLVSLKNVEVSNGIIWDGFKCHWRLSSHKKIFGVSYLRQMFSMKLKRMVVVRSAINGQQDWANNYFHWMTELLPQILAISDFKEHESVLIHEYYLKYDFISQSIALFQLPVITYSHANRVLVNKLYAAEVPHVGRFNEYLLRGMISKLNEALPHSEKPYRRIYISRSRSRRRKLTNEEELIDLITKHGFEVFFPEDHLLVDQIRVFRESAIVISNHGAGLTNIMFMKEGSTVIELKADNNNYWCYFSLARVFSLNYYYLLCKGDRSEHRDADITVELDSIEKLLNKMLAA